MPAVEFSYPFNATFDPGTGMPVLNPNGEPDRLYDAEDDQHSVDILYTSGVFAVPTENLRVEPLGGLTVVLRQGYAVNVGTRYSLTGDDLQFQVPTPDTQYTRKDIIVNVKDSLNRTTLSLYRTGTPSTDPQPPTLTRTNDVNELQYCIITVLPNATNITSANIQDTRLDGDVCGIPTFRGAPIDVTSIVQQFQTHIDQQIAMWDSIRNQEQSDWQAQTDQQQSDWNAFIANVHIDIQNLAIFNFDNLAALINSQRVTTFPTSTTIQEIISITSSGQLVATRLTTMGATITSRETLYLPDGTTISRTSLITTTFMPDGSIQEVITP